MQHILRLQYDLTPHGFGKELRQSYSGRLFILRRLTNIQPRMRRQTTGIVMKNPAHDMALLTERKLEDMMVR